MTVASSTDRATFPGNGVTQIFPLPFRFFANSEIQAWLVTNATGALTALTLGTHYTLSGAGDPEVDGNPTSELTMLTAPTSLQSLFVQRVLPVTQPTDIINQGRFFPETHETVFDRLTMLLQQTGGDAKGAIRVAVGDPEPPRLPPFAQRANMLLSFDALGQPTVTAPVPDSATALAIILADMSDPTKGAARIGYKGRTLKDKADNCANVLDDNGAGPADPTGTVDSTAAFLAAANLGTGSVYAPAGTYLLNITAWPAGTLLVGNGVKTIIKPLTPEVRGAITINSSSSTTFIDDLTFYNLTFLGDVAVSGFSEQKHLITLNGVRNAMIYRCRFIGFRGDGVYIGSGDVGGLERHNINVKVVDCYFDGVNNDNRNGVSVIDVSGLLIERCSFVRTTRSNMPAAIDIEPNANPFMVVENVTIRHNRMEDCRGGVFVQIIDYFTYPSRNFNIYDNLVKNCAFGIVCDNSNASAPGGTLSDSSVSHQFHVYDNRVIGCTDTPFSIMGAKGAVIENNVFDSCASHVKLGNGTFSRTRSRDVTYRNNRHLLTGSVSGKGIAIDGIVNLKFNGNFYEDCGTGIAPSPAIDFIPSTSGAVVVEELRGNVIVAPTAKTINAITETGAGTITVEFAEVKSNNFNGLPSLIPEDAPFSTITVALPNSAGPYDLTIPLPSASSLGRVNHISAGWTYEGRILHYAQYLGVILRGATENQQAVAISATGSAGHSIVVQAVTATSVTLRLTYSFAGNFTVTIFG